MVQIEALSTPECQEAVPSPGGQQEGEHGGSWLCHSTYNFEMEGYGVVYHVQ